MSEIDKIKRYIALTKMKDTRRYSMSMKEVLELSMPIRTDDFSGIEAVVTAFEYGKAKGYRAAKAEVRA